MAQFGIAFLFFTIALFFMLLALTFSKYKQRGESSCAHGHCATHLDAHDNLTNINHDDHVHGACYVCPEKGTESCTCDD